MATERIPLTQPIESRTGSFAKDSYSSNCIFETRDQKREFVKRPGLVARTQITSVTPPAYLQSQGLFGYGSKLISVINNTVYSTNPSTYSTTTVGTTSTVTNPSYFASTFLNSHLFFHNKSNGYLLDQSNNFKAIDNSAVAYVSIDNGGSNYSSGITLSFSSGTAAATATVSDGAIIGINITNYGTGYSSAPTITINLPATKTPTGTGSSGAYTVVVSSASGIYVGMGVTGTNIGTSAVVSSIAGTTITLSVANSGTVSGTLTFTDNGYNGVLTPYLNQYPTDPLVCGIAFLDNYVFVGTTTNRIYNSNVGDPTVWNALSYTTFEQTSDNLVGITKYLNYVLAFGSSSLQFFYDSGASVGSPLAVAPSYTSEIGCAAGDSIVSSDNTVIWVGTSNAYGRSVYALSGVTPTRISTATVDRHLEADNLSQVSAYTYTVHGHVLYILTLHNTNKTLVYDLSEKIWYTWTQYAIMSNDQPNAGTYQESYFRPTFYAEVGGVPYLLSDDTATLYQLDVGTYQDDGQAIYCRTVTDILDNGTTKRKFYGRLEIIGDKVSGGVMQVCHSGDDYNTWSSYRSIDLNASRSQIYLSGADRRRAWQFLCTSNVPLRLDGAEIDFRIGEMDQEQSVGGGRYRR